MGNVTTIGLDIAKSVFQVHGVDAAGEVVVRRKLTRGRVLAFFEKLTRCLVGIEACSSSHYWARELTARGHDVRLLPAQYVKPYLKRQKNDAADAEAICEAVTRPTMRFVPVKSPEQQSDRIVQCAQPGERQPAKQLAKHAHGREKAGLRRPTGSVEHDAESLVRRIDHPHDAKAAKHFAFILPVPQGAV